MNTSVEPEGVGVEKELKFPVPLGMGMDEEVSNTFVKVWAGKRPQGVTPKHVITHSNEREFLHVCIIPLAQRRRTGTGVLQFSLSCISI